MVSAAAMAGWDNVRKRVYQPRLKSIKTGSTTVLLNNFIINYHNLAQITGASCDPYSSQWLVWEACLATKLRWLEYIIDTYGENHLVVNLLKTAALKAGISFETILAWGVAVRADFMLNNASRYPALSDEAAAQTTAVLDFLKIQSSPSNSVVIANVSQMEIALKELQKQVTTLSGAVLTLTRHIANMPNSASVIVPSSQPAIGPTATVPVHDHGAVQPLVFTVVKPADLLDSTLDSTIAGTFHVLLAYYIYIYIIIYISI